MGQRPFRNISNARSPSRKNWFAEPTLGTASSSVDFELSFASFGSFAALPPFPSQTVSVQAEVEVVAERIVGLTWLGASGSDRAENVCLTCAIV
jgi:hypothetical protein